MLKLQIIKCMLERLNQALLFGPGNEANDSYKVVRLHVHALGNIYYEKFITASVRVCATSICFFTGSMM